jgi:predicted TPR repeat methyltransferase
MQLLTAAENEHEANSALEQAIASERRTEAAQRIIAVRRLWDAAPHCFAALSSIARLARQTERGDKPATTADVAALFDSVHAISPEAGVALYSLGQPSLLEAATQEIVSLMDACGLCTSKSRVLDVGCGTGRMLQALAPRVREIVGVDISQAMADSARWRIAHLPNASVLHISGHHLAEVTRPFDLILAVDSFPYLVQTGVAESMFAACARLLAERGYLLILNYSYRGDIARDCGDVTDLAAGGALRVLRAGTQDLKLWDGTTFLLQKT